MAELKSQKRIVIVSFSTYPRSNPRSLRTHELARELSRQGHAVTLYVLTGNYDYSSYEADTGVRVKPLGKTRFFDFEPEQGLKQSFFSKVIRRVVGRFFEFPNIELMTKAYSAVKNEKNIDLLISIAAPHPLHWGVALAKSKLGERFPGRVWVADCGDPYMGNPFQSIPFYFKYVEKWFCHLADFISVPVEEARNGYYSEFSGKIKVIPQGFRFERFNGHDALKHNVVPTFVYAGTFYEKFRDPRPFLEYLSGLESEFVFVVYTKTKCPLEEYKKVLGDKLRVHDYIPREDLILEFSKADFLINFPNESTVQAPSKLIDYALSGTPILNWVNGDKKSEFVFNEFLSGIYSRKYEVDDLGRYDIETVSRQFLSLLS